MFDDIRPYHDDEVVSVIQKLINEQALITSIASFKLPKLYKFAPKLTSLLIKLSLKVKLKQFTSIDKIQLEVAKYLNRLLKKTTSGFTYHGLEGIDLNKPAIFMSNHRDIVLDVALVNLALFESGAQTVEAAVGDNLLNQPWVSDLMRLNKSFIVKRSEKTKRAMLMASKQLSAYIHDSITNQNKNIWIAQREGRAKDGLDLTNSALISMLLLNKNKEQSIESYLDELNIIPVSISYELDPCDKDKAIELIEREQTGEYSKDENEDLRSITQGLVGKKGHVHVEFGQPIKGDFADSKAIAAAIDEQVIGNYKLYDTNTAAHASLNQQDADADVLATLQTRMSGLNSEQQQKFLTMYANPVSAKQALTDK